MYINTASKAGVTFLVNREDSPERAYLDPGGVVTIGPGFTMGSRVFSAYWRKTRGHALRLGDTLSRDEALTILSDVLDQEYGPAVSRAVAPEKQNVFDGALSATYNMGIGGLAWKWAQALHVGLIAKGATLLRTTAVTAGGVPLAGLRVRRALEADLIENGNYGVLVGTALPDGSVVSELQTGLQKLGYYTGSIDGDPGSLTEGAVMAFQRANDLTVDGDAGPATRATIARRLQDKTRNTSATGAGLISGGGSTTWHGLPVDTTLTVVLVCVAVAVVVFIGFTLWHNRGKLTGTRTPV